jgi:hypothetical protein
MGKRDYRGLAMQLRNKIKLEYVILSLLVIVLLGVSYLRYFDYITLVIAAIIGTLLFIIFSRNFTNNKLTPNTPKLSESKRHTLRLTLSILFFVFYGLSFLALLQGFYTKTPLYYVSIALCFGFLAIEILLVDTKSQGYFNLLKSFLLVLSVALTNQILFPYGIGFPDSNFHIFDMVIPIINTGHIPLGYTYSNFPGHHLLVAVNSLISGADPRMLYYCLGGFVMSLGLLFVFLIGKKFVNLKFGLFAALIYACSDYLMSWAAHPTHMTYTYFLAIMIFALTLYLYHKRDARFIAFFIIVATTMIFTHHLSAAVILIMLAAMLVVELVWRARAREYEFKVAGLTMLFMVALFAQWMYYSGTTGTLAGVFQAYYDAFTHGAAAAKLTTAYFGLPVKMLVLNEIGSGILIMLSVIGFLHFSKHSSAFKKFVIAIVIALLLLIGIEVVLKQSYFEAHRMYSFLQELSLVFLASCAIIWMLNNFRTGLKPLLIIGLICLPLFSLGSILFGEETSIFKGDRPYWKIYETPYEVRSAQWAGEYIRAGSNVTESRSFRGSLEGFSQSRLPIKEVENAQGEKIIIIDTEELPEGTFIIFSQFDIDVGFAYGRVAPEWYYLGGTKYAKLDPSALSQLEGYDKLYDDGMVSIYDTS